MGYKMIRKGIEVKSIFCEIESGVYGKLTEYSKATGLNKNLIVEKALISFLDNKRGKKC